MCVCVCGGGIVVCLKRADDSSNRLKLSACANTKRELVANQSNLPWQFSEQFKWLCCTQRMAWLH